MLRNIIFCVFLHRESENIYTIKLEDTLFLNDKYIPMAVYYRQLRNDDLIITALEITCVPNYVDFEDEAVNEASKRLDNLGRAVTEVLALSHSDVNDICIELLVCSSHPAEKDTQLSEALPHIFLLVYYWRKNDGMPCRDAAMTECQNLMSILKSALDSMVYSYRDDSDADRFSYFLNMLASNDYAVSLVAKAAKNRQELPPPSVSLVSELLPALRSCPGQALSLMFCSKGRSGFGFEAIVLAPQGRDSLLVGPRLLNMFKMLCPEGFFMDAMSLTDKGARYPDYFKMRIASFNIPAHSSDGTPCSVLQVSELKALWRLPVGEGLGFGCSIPPQRLPLFPDGMLGAEGSIDIGRVVGSKTLFTLPLADNTGHLSVLGISGSGKSSFLLNLIVRFWNRAGKKRVPFLVIDPISTEYRQLCTVLDGSTRLQVFTPGKNWVSPLLFNPFALPTRHVTVAAYKNILSDVFIKSLHLFSPLNLLLPQALDECYRRFGWRDDSTLNFRPGRPFNIDDFIECFNDFFNELGYSGESSNIGVATKVRLQHLKPYFDTYAPLPLEDLCSGATVVELAALQNSEAKSMLMIFLLKMVRLYLEERAELDPPHDASPRLALLMDEAHCILNIVEGHAETCQAQIAVVGMLNDMLDEVRKYGLSMILADQTASVLKQVMAKTHTQLVLNLQMGNEDVAAIIGLKKPELLRTLKTFEGYVKHHRLPVPIRVMTSPRPEGLRPMSDDMVHRLMCYGAESFWPQHRKLAKPYPHCSDCPHVLCDSHVKGVSADVADSIAGSMDSLQICRKMEELGSDGTRLKPYLLHPDEKQHWHDYQYCVITQLKRKIGRDDYLQECVRAGAKCVRCDQKVRAEGKLLAENLIDMVDLYFQKGKQLQCFKLSNIAKERNLSPDQVHCLECRLRILAKGRSCYEYLFDLNTENIVLTK